MMWRAMVSYCPHSGGRHDLQRLDSEPVRPCRTDRLPRASLPIMPPRGQRLCDDGSGLKVRPYRAVALSQRVQNQTRLDPRRPRIRVDVLDPAHVTGEVQHHTRADRVARHAGAGAAHGERHPRIPAAPHHCHHVVRSTREDHCRRRHR
jgi:hypothetical protein